MSISDPVSSNPIPPASPAASSSPEPQAPVTATPATPAATPQAPPPAPSVAPPAPAVTPTPAPASPKPSASQTLGSILANIASVLNGILPAIPAGAITAGATIAEAGLRAVAEWLTTKGSDNALTEQQAQAALTTLLQGLATLANPLPSPETLEAETTPPATSAT